MTDFGNDRRRPNNDRARGHRPGVLRCPGRAGVIADLGEHATLRFVDFFTANIRNPNTRAAYAVAVRGFFAWLEKHGPADLGGIRTHHVSTYVEVLARTYKAPTVKQHLAAIRMLFDWLIVGQVVGQNPAAAVRGPKHVVKKGKTPVLDGDEAKTLLASIDISTVVGLRDRALIALLIYSFARISAALHMNVEDYYPQGKRWWVRLHEKGGKQHEMPCHHLLETYIDAYVTAAGIGADKTWPLFRTLGGRGRKQLVGGTHEPAGRAADDRPSRPRGRDHHRARLPYVPGDRHHRLSAQRRTAGIRAADGGARERAHDQALRSAQRSGHARSG